MFNSQSFRGFNFSGSTICLLMGRRILACAWLGLCESSGLEIPESAALNSDLTSTFAFIDFFTETAQSRMIFRAMRGRSIPKKSRTGSLSLGVFELRLLYTIRFSNMGI